MNSQKPVSVRSACADHFKRQGKPAVFYVIVSNERDAEGKGLCYFVAIHGWTPMFSSVGNARKFASEKEASDYANKELFTSPDAFKIEQLTNQFGA